MCCMLYIVYVLCVVYMCVCCIVCMCVFTCVRVCAHAWGCLSRRLPQLGPPFCALSSKGLSSLPCSHPLSFSFVDNIMLEFFVIMQMDFKSN